MIFVSDSAQMKRQLRTIRKGDGSAEADQGDSTTGPKSSQMPKVLITTMRTTKMTT
jgi:hypothetical protein